MYTRMSNSITPQRQRLLLHTLLAFGMVFFFTIGVAGNTPVAHASGTPGGNVTDPVVRAIDIAKPAVVRIYTQLNAQLSVHFLLTKSVTFPQIGSGYLLTFSGSGTLISAHGDILTADHVVNLPHDQQLSQPLDMQAAPDVANYINQNLKPNPLVTQDQVTQELTSGQLPSDPSYGTSQSVVFLSTDYTGPLDASTLNSVPQQFQAPVDRIEAESAVNQNDVAIVHASLNDMASVQLGDSSSVQQQDMLTIIGFPGNGDVSTLPTNLLTSSVNQITVSSIKTTDQGAQVIQVGGNVEDGDSGGPALDSNGAVVGIVSFGLSDQSGTNFLQASNSARALVQSLHLDTAPGPFETAWSQAFNDYAATTPGHWHKAQQEFASIHTAYPQFKALLPYLQYAQAQVPQERVQQSRPRSTPHSRSKTSSPLAWIIPAVMVIIVLALALFALTLRRRKKKQPLTPATLPPVFPAQMQQALRDADAMAAFDAPTTTPPKKKGPLTPVILQPMFPAQTQYASQDTDALVAFGASTTTLRQEQVSVQPHPSGPLAGMAVATARTSGELRPELNFKNARFYSMWGGPVPQEYMTGNELEATPTLD